MQMNMCESSLTSTAHPRCCKQSLLQLKQNLVRTPSTNVHLSLSSLRTVRKCHKASAQLGVWYNRNRK